MPLRNIVKRRVNWVHQWPQVKDLACLWADQIYASTMFHRSYFVHANGRVNMFELSDFKRGDRIRIHPASDWFMRGETHARVTVRKYLTVKGERSDKSFKLHVDHVLEIK
jgi:hypothetical protein